MNSSSLSPADVNDTFLLTGFELRCREVGHPMGSPKDTLAFVDDVLAKAAEGTRARLAKAAAPRMDIPVA